MRQRLGQQWNPRNTWCQTINMHVLCLEAVHWQSLADCRPLNHAVLQLLCSLRCVSCSDCTVTCLLDLFQHRLHMPHRCQPGGGSNRMQRSSMCKDLLPNLASKQAGVCCELASLPCHRVRL